VERVGTVVGEQRVGRPVVEGVDLCARDAVGNAADGLAEVGHVVVYVVLLRGEALHNVGAGDLEGLDDGAEGQKGDLVS